MDLVTAVPAYLSIAVSIYVFVQQQRGQAQQQREQERRNQWERQLQEQQQQNELIRDQPRLVAIGSALVIHHEVVPQWLDATAAQQRVTIANRGKTTPSDVQAVLFPRASNLPAGTPPQARTDELFGTYWEGELDDGPEPGQQVELILSMKRFPLGDLSLIPDRTLFAPPEPDSTTALGAIVDRHRYFGRLTLTYRDAFGRLLAADFDGESVPHDNGLTQKWRHGFGPVVVAQDVRMLSDEAVQNAKPPVIG